MTHRSRKGFGLLEVILVFAIVIGAAAVVFGVYEPAQREAAATHDRLMVQTMASNTFALFPMNWNDTGHPVNAAYFYDSTPFGGAFCDWHKDPTRGIGCFSAMTGTNVMLGGASAPGPLGGPRLGMGVNIAFFDLTTAQCASLLAGGPASIGAVGVEFGDGMAHQLKTEAAVVDACNSNASGGYLNYVALDFSPSNQWPAGQLEP